MNKRQAQRIVKRHGREVTFHWQGADLVRTSYDPLILLRLHTIAGGAFGVVGRSRRLQAGGHSMTLHTARQLCVLVGRRALLKTGPLRVLVHVLDARQCWDRVDCLVSPVAGDGQQWVSVDRLENPIETSRNPQPPALSAGV
jgi:hypothetical protein